jgi:polysaccharide biosynthesis protein PslH
MNWLFVAADAWPITNGTALRVWHLCRHLRLLGDDVAVVSDVADDHFRGDYERERITVFRPDAETPVRRSRWDPFEERPAIAREVAVRSGGFDVVVLSGPSSLQYAGGVARGTPIVVDMIDDAILETRRRRAPRVGALKWMRRLRLLVELRRYERRRIGAAKAVSFVSDTDRESFRGRNAGTKTFVSPNGVDLDYWSVVADSPVPAESSDVVFFGNLSFYPNRLAAALLLKQVAPLVWQRHPQARFRLLGPNPPQDLAALAGPRAEITGMVPDVRPYLASAAAVCIPMTAGTGIKNKFLEAWAAARAVVATPLACQGLPAAHGSNALIAAKPEGLAEHLCCLLEDAALRRGIGDAGRRAVQDGFSWDHVAREFRAAVVGMCGVAGHPDCHVSKNGTVLCGTRGFGRL